MNAAAVGRRRRVPAESGSETALGSTPKQPSRFLLRSPVLRDTEPRMSVSVCVAAGAAACYVIVFYCAFRAVRCSAANKLFGKTVIVTGGNSGIGKATAVELAKRGARVILACRSKDRAEPAVFDIRTESGNNQVVFMELDLASFKSVRAFAETFLKTEPRLDILINNAGVIGPGCTEDGFELSFGVNHLGHFLLTNLLRDRLQQCAPSRVITVSALLHHVGTISFPILECDKDAASGRSTWHHLQAYCNSKLCNVLFTRELADRVQGSGVSCYCLHPGVIHTDLCRSLSPWQRFFLLPFAKMLFLDPGAGSQTTLHCALQDGLEAFSGRYFTNCAVQQVGVRARDDTLARKLWEVSVELTGLS